MNQHIPSRNSMDDLIIIDDQDDYMQPIMCVRSPSLQFDSNAPPALRSNHSEKSPNSEHNKSNDLYIVPASVYAKRAPAKAELNKDIKPTGKIDFTDNMWGTMSGEERVKLLGQMKMFRDQLKGPHSPLSSQVRRDATERLFASVIYGMEELNKNVAAKSKEELAIKTRPQSQQYSFARKLALSIQLELLKAFPRMNNNLSNSYPSVFAILSRHLRDEFNSELRRKVLLNQLTPQKLVTSKQQDLWSSKKRQEFQNQQNKFLKSRTLEKPVLPKPQDESIIDSNFSQEKYERKKIVTSQQQADKTIKSRTESLRKIMTEIPKDWFSKIQSDLPEQISKILRTQLKQILEKKYEPRISEEHKQAKSS